MGSLVVVNGGGGAMLLRQEIGNGRSLYMDFAGV